MLLTLLVRVAFVVLITASATAYGHNYFTEGGFPIWLAGAIGFAVAITLIAIEEAFRRRFARAIMTLTLGLFGGLLLSRLILNVLDLAIQNPAIRHNVDVPLVLIVTYLAIVTVLHHADRFRIIIPFVELRAQHPEEGSTVCDLSALLDSRLSLIAQSGLLGQRILVHERSIKACQSLAEEDDELARGQGLRGLNTLAELRAMEDPWLHIEQVDLPQATNEGSYALELARLEGARLCSAQGSLIARAKAENLSAINLAQLTAVFHSGLQPGDRLTLHLERVGEQSGQGVGFHHDGSMVIVSGGEALVGKHVDVLVKRLHHNAHGRLVFAEILKQGDEPTCES